MDLHSGRIEFSVPPQLFPLTCFESQDFSGDWEELKFTGICISGTSGAGC